MSEQTDKPEAPGLTEEQRTMLMAAPASVRADYNIRGLKWSLDQLLTDAAKCGFVITVSVESLEPFTMGNYQMVSSIYPAHGLRKALEAEMKALEEASSDAAEAAADRMAPPAA